MPFKDRAMPFLGCLFYTPIIVLYVIGIIHSERKHGDEGILIWFIPPWTIYRGVESFWHKDSEIDWQKKKIMDVRSAVYLIAAPTEKEANISEINKSIEEFSDKIKDYPDSIKGFLKEGSRDFIEFNMSSEKDIYDSLSDYIEKGYSYFKFSGNTDSLRQVLASKFGLEDLMKSADSAYKFEMEKMSSLSDRKLSDAELTKFKELVKRSMDLKIPKINSDMKMSYKEIFNEDY